MKKRSSHRIRKKAGQAPGTLVHVGERKLEKTRLTLIDYLPERFTEEETTLAASRTLPESASVSWLNVDGLHDVELIRELGSIFGLHPLTLEDILNTEHRPKCEDFDTYLFIILRMLGFDPNTGQLTSEQVSLVLGPRFVLSFQERSGDAFEPVRERLRSGKGRIRRSGGDYLAYALLDAVVDSYFEILEGIGDRLEDLETELIERPTPETLKQIHRFKREMILVRRSIWPLREVISTLQRQEASLVQEATLFFLRDVYDHAVQVVDTVESYRDIISGMLDLYLSSLSNRMNEVMKVLTMMATIFIPLTLIVGIYGMNFEYMPELKWRWGYPAVWLVMIALGVGMALFFRKKKWL